MPDEGLRGRQGALPNEAPNAMAPAPLAPFDYNGNISVPQTSSASYISAVEKLEEQDCAVCLQKCDHPTWLPCGHIFCFLCVKGVAIQSKKCAMCRAQIPPDYLDHPVLLEKTPQASTEVVNQVYQWYYEGRNGWWKYDERSNVELENAYNAGSPECTLLLAGAVYWVNFQNMVQMRQSDRTRRRRVQRDTPTLPAKGIAGIKIESQGNETKNETDNSNTIDPTSNYNEEPVEIVDRDDGETSRNNSSQDNEMDEVHEFWRDLYDLI